MCRKRETETTHGDDLKEHKGKGREEASFVPTLSYIVKGRQGICV